MALFTDNKTVLIVGIVVAGAFLGVNNTLITEAVMGSAPVERGVASAAYSFVRFAGGAAAPWLAGKLGEHVSIHCRSGWAPSRSPPRSGRSSSVAATSPGSTWRREVGGEPPQQGLAVLGAIMATLLVLDDAMADQPVGHGHDGVDAPGRGGPGAVEGSDDVESRMTGQGQPVAVRITT